MVVVYSPLLFLPHVYNFVLVISSDALSPEALLAVAVQDQDQPCGSGNG